MKIAGELKPGQIGYIEANGTDLQEMKANLLAHPGYKDLYDRGDFTLVWVNEGDIDVHNLNVELGAYKSDPDVGI